MEEANSALNDTGGFDHDSATVGVWPLKVLVKDIKKNERTSLSEEDEIATRKDESPQLADKDEEVEDKVVGRKARSSGNWQVEESRTVSGERRRGVRKAGKAEIFEGASVGRFSMCNNEIDVSRGIWNV